MIRKFFRNSIKLIFMILLAIQTAGAADLIYQYDLSGNLINDGSKYYEYNDANRLVRVRNGSDTGAIIAEYFYDHQGQRIKKIENGITTYYIGKHYETKTGNGETKNTSYYFANGERVAKKDSSGNMFYYHADHLGGTNVITNASGTLVERTSYYPFGEIREGGTEQYTYTGKERDAATNLYYYEARYYAPDRFEFSQADTAQPNYYDPQDLNVYAYARNNPIKYIDPTGHTWWKPWTWFAKESRNFYTNNNTSIQKSTDLAVVDLPKPNRNPMLGQSFEQWSSSIGYGKPRYDSPYHHSYTQSRTYEVDISGKLNSPINAFKGGIVLDVGQSKSYGNCIIIQDNEGNKNRYAHLASYDVNVGDPIDDGQPIAYMGNTGNVLKSDGSRPNAAELSAGFGTHIHYEIRDTSGKLISPYDY